MNRFILAAALALSACSPIPGTPIVDTLETRDWREAATLADADRLRDWRSDFTMARAEAIEAGHGTDLAELGALADPDAALQLGDVPTGDYRCRTVKLGSRDGGTLPFVAYPYFECRIRAEDDLKGFAKLTGSQRPVGLLFPDDAYRKIFLGTLVLGDEDRALRYGADPDRDMIGALQRIGPDRFRLVLPSPRFESRLDLIELVPETE